MRTHRLICLWTTCLFSLSAQDATHRSFFKVQYSPVLKVASRADLDRRLRAPFADGAAHPAGVSNCTQLLTKRGQQGEGQGPEQEMQAERATMAECLVMQELRQARPSRSSYVHNLPWDDRLMSLLPPQLAITVSNETRRAAAAAASRGQNWQDFDPSATASVNGPEDIVVTGKGFREQLTLWGRGDFNGDGVEDLLVQSLDTLTEGTYRNTRLFVLTRHTKKGRLSLVRSLL